MKIQPRILGAFLLLFAPYTFLILSDSAGPFTRHFSCSALGSKAGHHGACHGYPKACRVRNLFGNEIVISRPSSSRPRPGVLRVLSCALCGIVGICFVGVRPGGKGIVCVGCAKLKLLSYYNIRTPLFGITFGW